VDDLIEGFIRTIALSANPGPINLGNPNEFTMLELAEKIQAIVGTKLPVEFSTMPVDDPRQRCPDISKAKQMLNGWEPKVQLQEGLTKSIAYFRGLKK